MGDETTATIDEAVDVPGGPDAGPAEEPPSPESSRRRPDIAGKATVLGDGREWLLADYVPDLTHPIWNTIYTAAALYGRYEVPDVWLAASLLFRENYEMDPALVAWLIARADPQALAEAVEAALFPPPKYAVSKTYAEWAIGGLYSVGLDPATIPPRWVKPVLFHLVVSGRIAPPERGIGALEARMRKMRDADGLT